MLKAQSVGIGTTTYGRLRSLPVFQQSSVPALVAPTWDDVVDFLNSGAVLSLVATKAQEFADALSIEGSILVFRFQPGTTWTFSDGCKLSKQYQDDTAVLLVGLNKGSWVQFKGNIPDWAGYAVDKEIYARQSTLVFLCASDTNLKNRLMAWNQVTELCNNVGASEGQLWLPQTVAQKAYEYALLTKKEGSILVISKSPSVHWAFNSNFRVASEHGEYAGSHFQIYLGVPIGGQITLYNYHSISYYGFNMHEFSNRFIAVKEHSVQVTPLSSPIEVVAQHDHTEVNQPAQEDQPIGQRTKFSNKIRQRVKDSVIDGNPLETVMATYYYQSTLKPLTGKYIGQHRIQTTNGVTTYIPHGKGKLFLEEKEVSYDNKANVSYEGEFSGGFLHGQGTLIYLGPLRNNLGTLYESERDMYMSRHWKYSGGWCYGKRHGQGCFTDFESAKLSKHGIWKDGERRPQISPPRVRDRERSDTPPRRSSPSPRRSSTSEKGFFERHMEGRSQARVEDARREAGRTGNQADIDSAEREADRHNREHGSDNSCVVS